MPPSEPLLNSSLISFNGLISKQQEKYHVKRLKSDNDIYDDEIIIPKESMISPIDISDFMENLGRPPTSKSEATSLLSAMLEYDDCTSDPNLKIDTFNLEMLIFVKKTNALKDFK